MSRRLSSVIRALRDAGQGRDRDTESVVSALIKLSQRLPSELYRSLTWDRCKGLADHLTLATEVEVYFCAPRSPWPCGSNENTNRLLRQYLPRGADLPLHSHPKLSAIARQHNEGPERPCYIKPQRQVRGMCCSDQLNPPSVEPNYRCNWKSSATVTRRAFAILRIESSVGFATPRSISLMNA